MCFCIRDDSSVLRRLTESTFTSDEVADMLDGLCAVVRGDVETELIHSAHTNALLLRQVSGFHHRCNPACSRRHAS